MTGALIVYRLYDQRKKSAGTIRPNQVSTRRLLRVGERPEVLTIQQVEGIAERQSVSPQFVFGEIGECQLQKVRHARQAHLVAAALMYYATQT